MFSLSLKRKLLWFLLPAIGGASYAQTSIDTQNFAHYINIAGRQRMLTQRLGKSAIYASLHVRPEAAQEQILSTIFMFERTHQQLVAYAQNNDPQLAKKLDDVFTQWQQYKEITTNSNDLKTALDVLKYNTELLKSCEGVVTRLDEQFRAMPMYRVITNNPRRESLIQSTGRMRSRAQRLAMYYATYHTGLQAEESWKMIQDAKSYFDTSLSGIIENVDANPQTQELITQIAKSWRSISDTDNLQTKKIPLTQMWDQTNAIVNHLDELVATFEKEFEAEVLSSGK
jgi:hypothetical protein